MKKTNNEYKLSLTVGGETYTGAGATPLEALQSFNEPAKVTKQGVVTYSHGELSKTLTVTPFQIKSLTWKIKRPLVLKNFEFGLK